MLVMPLAEFAVRMEAYQGRGIKKPIPAPPPNGSSVEYKTETLISLRRPRKAKQK